MTLIPADLPVSPVPDRTFRVSFEMTGSSRDVGWFGVPTAEWIDWMIRGGFPPKTDYLRPEDVPTRSGAQTYTGSVWKLRDLKVDEVK